MSGDGSGGCVWRWYFQSPRRRGVPGFGRIGRDLKIKRESGVLWQVGGALRYSLVGGGRGGVGVGRSVGRLWEKPRTKGKRKRPNSGR